MSERESVQDEQNRIAAAARYAELHPYGPGVDHGRKWQAGYRDQTAYMDGMTTARARQMLEARLGTVASKPYNDGATQAIRDYISESEG